MNIVEINDRLMHELYQVDTVLSLLRGQTVPMPVPRGDTELLVQVLHGRGTEDDEETHPKGGALEWNGLIGLSLFRLVV